MAKRFEGSERRELRNVVRTVRRRWRTRRVLRGVLLTALAAIAAFVLVWVATNRWPGGPTSVTIFSGALYLGVLIVAVITLVRPAMRRVDDRRVAHYLEEHEPGLKAQILTAVAALDDEADAPNSELVAGLIRSAVLRAREVDGGRRVDREPLKRLSWSTAGLAFVLALILLADPLGLRRSVIDVARPWTVVEAASRLSIDLAPGDTVLARGAELMISARLQGFTSEAVEVAMKPESSTTWERWPMPVVDEDVDAGAYQFRLFRVDEPMDYFVEAEGVQSGTHHVDVVDLPYVSQLELEIHHPAYTGLEPEIVEQGGDLVVLPGTRVIARAHPTIPVPAGTIVLEDVGESAMAPGEDGVLTGEFEANEPGFYHVDLEDQEGTTYRGTPDHLIDIVSDLAPVVSIERPGYDVRATSVEEVYVEADANDDYGIGTLELIYSINGGEDHTISLLSDSDARLAEVSAGHTFFLDDFDLQPGDLITYHVRALDNGPNAEEREARTDLFFIEVRPFSQDFRQADQGGGGGGGGGGGNDPMAGEFSERQRQIVTATFNVGRDWRKIAPDIVEEDVATIALSQESLKQEVEEFMQQLQTRLARAPEEMQQVAEELPLATSEMEAALAQLNDSETADALPPEQRALQHLLRAEAVFREIQLAQQQQGGGGGGGASGAEIRENLADFFDLEMDRLRNQYEELQQGQRQQMDQEVNEALERLRELARRQEQEQERLRRAAEQLQQGAPGAGGESQRRLAEDAEELARELERLSREYNSPDLAQTAQQLQEAANAMRQSAASRNQQGLGQAGEAQRRLEDARRLMEQDQANRRDSDAEEAVNQAQRALDRQRDIERAVEDMPTDPSARADAVPPILDQKDQLIQELNNLERSLSRMADGSADNPEAQRGFREAASAIRDDQLADRVDFGGSMIGTQRTDPDQAREFEGDITQRIEELSDRVQAAAESLASNGDSQASELSDRTRELVRAAESMQERARQEGQRRLQQGQQGDQQGQQGQGQQSGQQQGQQGQQGQGQQGQQGQGQQGQQGQGQQGQQGQGQQGQGGQQGQQGGQQQGGGNQFAGGDPNGFGGGAYGPIDPSVARQLSREASERRSQAEALRDQLTDANVPPETLQGLEGVIDQFRDLEALGIYGNPRQLAEVQSGLVESLRELDFEVRRAFATENREGPIVAGSNEVPEGYRELVEEYFRSLAR